MSDFLQSVLDMGTIHPTIYSDLQVASDGSFMSTEEADRLTSPDFSGIGFDNLLELYMDSAYAPFGAGPSFAYGAPDSEPSSMGANLLGDWPIPPSSPGASNTAHEDLVTQIPSPPPIERGFGNDLSNIERSTADLPPLVSSSSSSSGASTPKVATPTHLPSPISAPAPSLSPSSFSPPSSPSSGVSTPEVADMPSPVSAPTPSTSSETLSPPSPASVPAHSTSSPAGKSAKQRRNAAPSTRLPNRPSLSRPRNGTRSTRPQNRPSASRPRNAPIVPAAHKVMCILEDCNKGFRDRTAMLRHVITKHMRERHKCHGCDKSYTRLDALGRHLKKTELGSECRLAAMENGWVQVMSEDGINMSRPQRTDRVKKVADFLS